ncbi:hypothetical protein PLESTB_001914400 [Pleodorina starrii]|uniref:Transposase IS110-like N-terminal domain-containing protein n=1 Tax=Pleodorina starrii TaxID=330485 RepID=A0A9W6C2B0_9CHLO|nr:hypothetical protein PLESTB_001914400 [Pleodorina starrii]
MDQVRLVGVVRQGGEIGDVLPRGGVPQCGCPVQAQDAPHQHRCQTEIGHAPAVDLPNTHLQLIGDLLDGAIGHQVLHEPKGTCNSRMLPCPFRDDVREQFHGGALIGHTSQPMLRFYGCGRSPDLGQWTPLVAPPVQRGTSDAASLSEPDAHPHYSDARPGRHPRAGDGAEPLQAPLDPGDPAPGIRHDRPLPHLPGGKGVAHIAHPRPKNLPRIQPWLGAQVQMPIHSTILPARHECSKNKGVLRRVEVVSFACLISSAIIVYGDQAPVFTERTSVGLDVHARSVAAAAIDGATGELVQARLTPDHDHIRTWIRELPGPVAVAYEGRSNRIWAGPCPGIRRGPLQRPSGDRIKTDARDAVHLARLLRLDEITAVTVPGVEQEAARDLVRAREDCRGDLMRARHRVSKLLLRHGIVYTDGAAWTGAHHAWLARQHLGTPATRMAFDAEHEAVLATLARRDRLDAAITAMAADSQFTPVVHRLCCLRGIVP